MANLDNDIATYEGMRAGLEARHMGEWILIHAEELIGTYKSFDEAAAEAVSKFGRGPYLIRQVGAPPVVLPASVMYHPIYV
jgi:hypothetical protein